MVSLNNKLKDKRKHEVYFLPFPVNKIIPQKQTMRVIDFITVFDGPNAECEVTIKPDNIFLGLDGILSKSVYLELMAQSTAASAGYNAFCEGRDIGEGYLLGAKKIKVLGEARVGDKLTVKIFKDGQFGDFGIIQGTVFNDGKIIAQGELKVWAKNAG